MYFKSLTFVSLLLFSSISSAVEPNETHIYTYDTFRSLDLYLPGPNTWTPQNESRPAAIVIHGGGWSSGSRTGDMLRVAHWLAAQGMVVISVDYSLSTTHKWPTQITDVAQGVWWLKNNADAYNIDSNKILAVGGSAGGHLAAMLGQIVLTDPVSGEDSEVHGVVSLWGPWNLADLESVVDPAIETEKVVEDRIGNVYNLLPIFNVNAQVQASPIYYINNNSPRTLLFNGDRDGAAPIRQANTACAIYALKGLPESQCKVVPLPGMGHHWPVLPENMTTFVEEFQLFLNEWAVTPN